MFLLKKGVVDPSLNRNEIHEIECVIALGNDQEMHSMSQGLTI